MRVYKAEPVNMENVETISSQITRLRARVGQLSARAVAGEDLITGAITDGNESIDVAVALLCKGDAECAREALQLAEEQLDTAEQ